MRISADDGGDGDGDGGDGDGGGDDDGDGDDDNDKDDCNDLRFAAKTLVFLHHVLSDTQV